MQFPDSDFWNFSIHFYQQPGVADCCLALQENQQMDINLVLFGFWLGLNKQQILDHAQWQELIEVSAPWQEIIKPLRRSRKLVKQSNLAWPVNFTDETHDSISNIELNAEHMQQLAIEQAWQSFSESVSDENTAAIIRRNITAYMANHDDELSLQSIDAELSCLLNAADNYPANTRTIAL